MEIKSIRALWGPNFWSVNDYQLIVMEVAPDESEEPAIKSAGFCEALKNLLPGLSGHHVEEGNATGFFEIMKNDARVELVIRHMAIELQRLAGVDCGFGPNKRTTQQSDGYVVFPYENKEAGIYAGKAAVKLFESLAQGEDHNPGQDILEIKLLTEQNRLGLDTALIVNEVKKRNIPFLRLDDSAYIQLGYGSMQKRIEATIAGTTRSIATELAANKHQPGQILSDSHVHLQPIAGSPENEAASIIDMLFPGTSNGRIPIIAVTGTNGKTTTTRLLALMTRQGGFTTGYTTTDGIYLNKELVYKGDCSGPASARLLLRDPAVEFAVLESARGGIIRSGLGFDLCDCAVVTNIAEDHLGIDGIETIEGIAAVKSVVPETVKPDGFAVLNADDELACAMKKKLSCRVALFSLFPDNIHVQKHCANGGVAAILNGGCLIIRTGNRDIVIDDVDNIPITYNGKARFNVANALAATLAAYVTGICLPAIRCSLRNFSNSTELTPGRMNTFDFGDFTIMVDYAHNPHGLKALGEYIGSVAASKKTGVIAGVGDRRAEDIVSLGEEAAKIFDDIIIRMDANLRGRTESEIAALLTTGIQNIAPDKKVLCFSSELDAVEHAIDVAGPGTFTVILVENITSVSDYLQQRLNQQNNGQETIKNSVPA